MKFTIEGYIKIKIKNVSNDLLRFKIIDSGVGIKKSLIAKLGETAYETHNSSGLNNKGIGLGLFICRKIIQQLGPN